MNPHQLLHTAIHEESAIALTALLELRQLLDHLELEHVIALRQHGRSWTDIARILGITRQATRERFAHWEPTQT